MLLQAGFFTMALLGILQGSTGRLECENDSYQASLVRTEACEDCIGKSRHTFRITDRASGQAWEQVLDWALTKVLGLRILNDLLIVHGKKRAETIITVDLTSRKIRDRFSIYFAEFSPDSRYAVYRGFLRPMHLYKGPENDVLLLYDFSLSPEANREGIHHTHYGDVGRPIFPERNLSQRSYEYRVANPEDRVLIRSPYHWSETGNRIYFVSWSAKTDSYSMTEITMQAGGEPKLRKTPIPKAKGLDLKVRDVREGANRYILYTFGHGEFSVPKSP